MAERMNLQILKVSYHRNGVSGTGFNVVLFGWYYDEDYKRTRNMVATVFPQESGLGLLSVFDVDELRLGNIEFANGNSWRGDDFEPELRAAIQQHDEQLDIDLQVERILKGE